MRRLLLTISFAFFLFLGFQVKSAFAFTCTAVAGGGNWGTAATWSSCNSTVPQAGDDVVINSSSGNVVVNVQSNSLQSLNMAGYTGTLSGASTIIVKGLTASTKVITFAGTVSWTGTLNIQFVSGTAQLNLTTNGQTLNSIIVGTNNGTLQLQDDLNFANNKLLSFSIGAAVTVDLNGHGMLGNSSINRILIQSSTLGTQRTITVNGGTFANTDFQDISLSVNTDLSAITGLSGDCGGNSNITFTPATTTTDSETTTFNWSTGVWSVRVPLPQDDVIVNGAFSSAQSVAIDMPRPGHSLDFSSMTWTGTAALVSAASVSPSIYGSLAFPAGMRGAYNGTNVYQGRTGTLANGTSSSMPVGGWTITSAGNAFNGTTINTIGGTYKLLDALNVSGTFAYTSGNLDDNNFNVTFGVISAIGTGTRTWTGGTGTITVTSTGNAWNFSGATNATLSFTGTTVQLTNTTSTAKNFFGNGYTYDTVTFAGDNIAFGGSGAALSNTFGTLNVNTAGFTTGLKLPSSATQTVTNFGTNGSAGNLAKLSASTSGTAATISKASGSVSVDYMSIQDSTATGGATWCAGANSTNVSGNTGWTFSACGGAVTAPPDAFQL